MRSFRPPLPETTAASTPPRPLQVRRRTSSRAHTYPAPPLPTPLGREATLAVAAGLATPLPPGSRLRSCSCIPAPVPCRLSIKHPAPGNPPPSTALGRASGGRSCVSYGTVVVVTFGSGSAALCSRLCALHNRFWSPRTSEARVCCVVEVVLWSCPVPSCPHSSSSSPSPSLLSSHAICLPHSPRMGTPPSLCSTNGPRFT